MAAIRKSLPCQEQAHFLAVIAFPRLHRDRRIPHPPESQDQKYPWSNIRERAQGGERLSPAPTRLSIRWLVRRAEPRADPLATLEYAATVSGIR